MHIHFTSIYIMLISFSLPAVIRLSVFPFSDIGFLGIKVSVLKIFECDFMIYMLIAIWKTY